MIQIQLNTNPKHCIKGTVQRDFRPPVFSSFELAWVTDQWVKMFSNFVLFLPRYSNFYEAPRSICRYCAESSSAQYHTARSQVPRSVKFRAVRYWVESSDFSVSFLKGQSSKIFELVFFITRVCLGHWVMG